MYHHLHSRLSLALHGTTLAAPINLDSLNSESVTRIPRTAKLTTPHRPQCGQPIIPCPAGSPNQRRLPVEASITVSAIPVKRIRPPSGLQAGHLAPCVPQRFVFGFGSGC